MHSRYRRKWRLTAADPGAAQGRNRIGPQPRLRERGPCGKNRPPVNGRRGRIYFCTEVRACCRSSVVEHSLGKGEVVSSILPGSTRKPEENQNLASDALLYPPHPEREQDANFRTKLGEKKGRRSCYVPLRDKRVSILSSIRSTSAGSVSGQVFVSARNRIGQKPTSLKRPLSILSGREHTGDYLSSISTSSTALFPLFSMPRSSAGVSMKS